jgi:BirA family transcriptional regulator, biotin operon repressor / biotin---[acetyl-CoA-carboxylase] ligase
LSEAPQSNREGMPSASIGTPFVELQSVDSTNNYAREQIHAGMAQHGQAIFAHEQWAGKGQRGRHWVSEKGQNMAVSILLQPKSLAISRQFELSAAIALAVHQSLAVYIPEDLTIKWPNDLYWQDRKAGGILIENLLSSHDQTGSSWNWAIAGIGININQTQFPSDLPNPVSLKQITGKDRDPVQLAKELCKQVDKYYQELLESGPGNIFSQYNRYLYKQGQKVKLKKDNRVFEALIKGVNAKGQLEVEHGISETFDFGTIEWVV